MSTTNLRRGVWTLTACLITQLGAITPAAADPNCSNASSGAGSQTSQASQTDLQASSNKSSRASTQETTAAISEEITSSGSVSDSLGGWGLSTVGMVVSLVMVASTVGLIMFVVVVAAPKVALHKAALYLNAHRRAVLDGFALGGGPAVEDFAGFFGIHADQQGRLGVAMRAAYPEIRALLGSTRHVNTHTTLATLGALVMQMRLDPTLRGQIAHMLRIVPHGTRPAHHTEAEARRPQPVVDAIPVPPLTALF